MVRAVCNESIEDSLVQFVTTGLISRFDWSGLLVSTIRQYSNQAAAHAIGTTFRGKHWYSRGKRKLALVNATWYQSDTSHRRVSVDALFAGFLI